MKRILFWSSFVVVIALIIWGLIAAGKKTGTDFRELAIPVSAAEHVLGSADAPVTLVEYSDFQCPACEQYFPLIERLVAESSTTMRFVYRHFPLYPLPHLHADLAARASEAAGLQGKFFEMYRALFVNQAEWENAKTLEESAVFYEKYAKGLGLDMAKYKVDIDSDTVKKIVQDQKDGGVKSGVNGTPTFFVNGNAIVNPRSYEEFKTIIESAAK